jgi:type I restriction enzyme, S subunit
MAQIRSERDVVAPEFLSWGPRDHRVQLQIELDTQGIGVPDLGLDKIGSMPIVVPPLREQQEIARRTTAQQDVIARNRALLIKLNSLKSGVMDDLLTGRVRVTPLASDTVPT